MVENLAQNIISGAFEQTGHKVARATIFRSEKVVTKTVLTVLRVRNVMKRKKGTGELVAEELVCWGYRDELGSDNVLSHDDVKLMLQSLTVEQDINPMQQEKFLTRESDHIRQHTGLLNELVKERSSAMVKLHTKYRKALGTEDYTVGTIVPPDVLGVYIVFPML